MCFLFANVIVNIKLSDERFDMMSQTYEAEQKELEAEVIRLQKEIEVQETQIQNIEKFIQKSSQYVGIEALAPYVLHELVKAIYVDAPDKSSGKRRQHIHIQYDRLLLRELRKEKRIHCVGNTSTARWYIDPDLDEDD